MKRYIKSASAGDILLSKFILIQMPKLEEYSENYDNVLRGYFYTTTYKYNKYTHESEDRIITHADMIDSCPSPIRRYGKDHTIIWGKQDYYRDEIKLFIVNGEHLSMKQVEYLRRNV